MLRIYDVPTAQRTILKRTPPEDTPLPAALLEGIARLFGAPLTPDQAVGRILQDVRRRGDAALRRWTARLDGTEPDDFRVPPEELQRALAGLPGELRVALEVAARRIEAFHRRQPLVSWVDDQGGGLLGQLMRPIRRVGIYVPGGTAPLPSTLLMAAIPARVAGVAEIVVATPPGRSGGRVDPSILAAGAISGVSEVYRMGGAQAIAALAYGTESIRPVDKIVGPGNLFVSLAKRQVYGVVGIDGLAGPTETVVIADSSANPQWVAADLLAQAEHDPLASSILLTPSAELARAVQGAVTRTLEAPSGQGLNRAEIIAASLESRGGAVLTGDLAEAVALSNAYGPEHLNLALAEPWKWLDRVTCAGGVFLGEHSPEVLGDYVAGPSHVMPTGGTARFASPLSVWDFVRLVSLVALDEGSAARLASPAARLARAEGLGAHARAAELREDRRGWGEERAD